VGAPPPSSGGAAIIGALRFLSGFAQPYSALLDTLSKHWFVEACRHVFAIRMSLSDPKFDPEENSNAVKDLIKGQYIELLLNMTLDNSVLNLSQYGGAQWNKLKDADVTNASLVDAQEGDRRRRRDRTRNTRLFNYLNDHGTSSLSVVDKNLNSVTITSSINLELGSKVVCPSTGVLLNNQMDDFSTPGRANFFGLHPSESNYIVPGKRPLSSMAPTMVFKQEGQMEETDNNLGKLVLSLGGSGGPKIITAVLSTILNYAFVGMPLFEAVSAPRIHNQLIYHGAVATNIEEETLPQGPSISLSERTRRALQKRGHDLIPTDYLGTVQAVSVDLETNSLSAVADIRKQGIPAGY
jgi:gamma-glutamyltranspeptidase